MLVPTRELVLEDARRLVLRSPTAADAPAMLAYVRALFAESWRNLNWPATHFDAMTEAEEEAFVDGVARHPKHFWIAACTHDDAIVGGVHLESEASTHTAHVASLGMSVRADWRGAGLGRHLLEAALSFAALQGTRHVLLRVRTFNEPAWRLYEKVGFQRVGTLRGVARLPDGEHDEYLYQFTAAE